MKRLLILAVLLCPSVASAQFRGGIDISPYQYVPQYRTNYNVDVYSNWGRTYRPYRIQETYSPYGTRYDVYSPWTGGYSNVRIRRGW